MVISESRSLANVKSKFSEMVDRVEHTHDRIIVTRNGRAAAVLILRAAGSPTATGSEERRVVRVAI